MPLFPLFALFNMIKIVFSKFVEGEIKTNEKWVFIARFCFLSEDGQFEYSIQYEKTYAPINLLLYYDSDQQWPAVYKSNKTCQQRESVLNRRLNQIITLAKSDFGSGCDEVSVNQNKTRMIQCHQGRKFHSSRERWWFIAVSNCNATVGLNLRYRFLMTNGIEGDYWHEHFSADEFYILPMLMSFCIVYILLVLAVIMCSMELRSRQLYHSTYKLFAVSVYLQELGIFIQCIAYIRYAVDGVGVPRLRNLGRICESASEVIFLLLLLLLAKGYTVTRGRLRLSSSVKLTIFMCIYVIKYITLFIYEQLFLPILRALFPSALCLVSTALFFDPGEVLYLYESPAGYGLVILRIVAWWLFMYATIFTLKHYPEKSSFYYPFNLVGTIWFVAGPAFILAANTLIDKWVRESVVCAVQHFIALAGHILFLILTVPNKANKNFPYHVRTTQIGIMEVTNGICGNNTMDHFGHHPYAPGGPTFQTNWSRVPVELFTISSPSQRNHIGPLERRFKMEESFEDRSFTPENLIIRPEEVMPTSTVGPSTSRARIQPAPSNFQAPSFNPTQKLQLVDSLHAPNNTVDRPLTEVSSQTSIITPNNTLDRSLTPSSQQDMSDPQKDTVEKASPQNVHPNSNLKQEKVSLASFPNPLELLLTTEDSLGKTSASNNIKYTKNMPDSELSPTNDINGEPSLERINAASSDNTEDKFINKSQKASLSAESSTEGHGDLIHSLRTATDKESAPKTLMDLLSPKTRREIVSNRASNEDTTELSKDLQRFWLDKQRDPIHKTSLRTKTVTIKDPKDEMLGKKLESSSTETHLSIFQNGRAATQVPEEWPIGISNDFTGNNDREKTMLSPKTKESNGNGILKQTVSTHIIPTEGNEQNTEEVDNKINTALQ